MVPNIAMTICTIGLSPAKRIEDVQTPTMMSNAVRFTAGRMPRCVSQSRIIGPNIGDCRSQRWSRGEELAKQ